MRCIVCAAIVMVGFCFGGDEGIAQPARKGDYTAYRVEAFGAAAAGRHTPFWMVSNRRGRVPVEACNGFVQAQVVNSLPIGPYIEWQTGIEVVAAAPRYRNAYVGQLYTEFIYKNLHLSIGMRDNRGEATPLTDVNLSSGSLSQSVNARAIPELNLFLSDFVEVPYTAGRLQLKGHFAVGRSFDTDFLRHSAGPRQHWAKGVRWHHKSLHLRLQDTRNGFPLSATLGLFHAAQWGGISTDPKIGRQPTGIRDFIAVVFSRSGGRSATPSDRINALGAHYGVYDLGIGYRRGEWDFQAYYQHIFGDRSGTVFSNGMDGLIGLRLQTPMRRLRTAVIERLSTLDQSGPFHFITFDHVKYKGRGGGADNYYNNGEYQTGYSYFGHSLGTPLLISPAYNDNGRIDFVHNRIHAWYAAAEGDISARLTYRCRLSAMSSFGTAYRPTVKRFDAVSFGLDLTYRLSDNWEFTATAAADRGGLLGNRVGAGLSIVRKGFLR